MHDPAADPVSEPAAVSHLRRRGAWLGALSVAALLLHWAALSGVAWTWPTHEPPPLPAATLQVRVVDAPAAPVAAVRVTEPLPPETAAVPSPPRPVVAVRSRPVPAAPPRAVAPAALAVPSVAEAAAPPPPITLALNAPAAVTAPSASPAEDAIPHYRTQLPPAATLRYEMQRGLLRGTGDLSWRPQGDHYELRLVASVSGLTVLTQVSTGGFDAAGIAPQRFTDQRLRRGTAAANFQRAAGKITFSGPSTEFPLRDGAQDRLSWMLQLAAIVAAEPHLATPGAKVVMYVVGSHGDASVWSFRCVGPETVDTRAGGIAAVRFTREPREPYDTTVQVWLDPLQHHLPVRATQKSGEKDEGFDLRLLEVIAAN